MGNKVSKPARKLTATIAHPSEVTKGLALRIQLPSQALKDRFEQSGNTAEKPIDTKPSSGADKGTQNQPHNTADLTHRLFASTPDGPAAPEGKDGMDPQADQNFIKFINTLGRQIHSHTNDPNAKPDQMNVRALKQLLNRKQLYEKGQAEVKSQLETAGSTRTMINPRTLTAIVHALHDPRVLREDITKDYLISADFLDNLERFKVAQNVVIIEETTKADEIGPKMGQPVSRAAADPALMDENGAVDEGVNESRMKELRSRLE